MIRPFRLSSYRRRASEAAAAGDRAAFGLVRAGAVTIIAVESQPARTRSSAAASRRSTLSAYFRFTATTRAANQHLLIVGSQSAASKAHLPPDAAAVHRRRGEGEVEEVRREAAPHGGAGSAEAAVVGLRDGHDMLDIGVAHAAVMPARVGAVDPASHGSDDPAFDGTRIGVVAPVVRRAAVFGRNSESVPGVGGGLAVAGEAMTAAMASAIAAVRRAWCRVMTLPAAVGQCERSALSHGWKHMVCSCRHCGSGVTTGCGCQ